MAEFNATDFIHGFLSIQGEGHKDFRSVQLSSLILYISYTTVVAFKAPTDRCALAYDKHTTQRHLNMAGFPLKSRVREVEFHERLVAALATVFVDQCTLGTSLDKARNSVEDLWIAKKAAADASVLRKEELDAHGNLFDSPAPDMES